MIDVGVIQQGCAAAGLILQTARWVSTIDSTNLALGAQLQNPHTLAGWHLLMAQQQTAGRGQRSKTWVSPPNGNWYFSLGYLHPSSDLHSINSLQPEEKTQPFISSSSASLAPPDSRAVGQSCLQAFSRLGVTDLYLKLPNDLLHQGRKLAGMLIDNYWREQCCYAFVAGVGVNVFEHPAMQSIDQPWTCLTKILSESKIQPEYWLTQLLLAIYAAHLPDYSAKT